MRIIYTGEKLPKTCHKFLTSDLRKIWAIVEKGYYFKPATNNEPPILAYGWYPDGRETTDRIPQVVLAQFDKYNWAQYVS